MFWIPNWRTTRTLTAAIIRQTECSSSPAPPAPHRLPALSPISAWLRPLSARPVGRSELFPSLLVEITGAERHAGQNQRSGRHERDRIERRGRQRNNTMLVRARGAAHITPVARRAKHFRE